MFHANSRKDNEENLEQFVRDLKNSCELPQKKQYWALPIYLYDLFHAISYKYLPTRYGFGSNYKALIDTINESNYDQLLWVNLNYDLLADQAISISTKHKLSHFKLDDYMSFETDDKKLRIKYTKPHGSVDWVRKLTGPSVRWQDIRIGLQTVPVDFSERLSEEIYTIHELPSGKIEEEYYPAITAPAGKDYSFVYKQHLDGMIEDLKNTSDVLCIGFSALDEDILDLLKYIPKIVKLKIVNKTIEKGKEAFVRMGDYYKKIEEPEETAIFNEGFTQFIGQDLQSWLSRNVT